MVVLGILFAAAVACRLAVGGDVIEFLVAGEVDWGAVRIPFVVELLRKVSVIFGAPVFLGVEEVLGAALLPDRPFALPGGFGLRDVAISRLLLLKCRGFLVC